MSRHHSIVVPVTVTILSTAILMGYCGIRWYKAVDFTQKVGGHLKLAADANSIEISEEKLELAVAGMNEMDLCPKMDDCFTSVWYRTPDEDIAFWRMNIEATLKDLNGMSDEERVDNLIVSNQLMKARETLLDSGQNGDYVTSPAGIPMYPHNGFYWWWGVLSMTFMCVGSTWWLANELRNI